MCVNYELTACLALSKATFKAHKLTHYIFFV